MPDELQTITAESVQQRATAPAEIGPSLLYWMAHTGDIVAPWWSRRRDADLRSFWMGSDHVSGAIYQMTSKMASVDFHVEPLEIGVKSYMRRAEELTRELYEATEFFSGWRTGVTKFVSDLLTQDNGAFFEIIGPGSKDGPLTGAPTGLAHIDAGCCLRTRSPEYPVVYMDTSGRQYKMHYTRVIAVSQLPSPNVYMNNVGFCAVSRMLGVAQNLIDMSKYKQEKLGSRPKRQLLVGQGITGEEIMKAFVMAENQLNAQGMTRYAGTFAIGAKSGQSVSIDAIDLASVPDGFNEQESTTLALFTIALALGVDARELWPASSSGATKADAMLQHMKARGKGPGQIRSDITDQINQKYLPYGYKIVFDVQDDEEDAEAANVKQTRATTRKVRMESGEINIRVAREQALADGDLTESQFDELELAEGRLPDGSDLMSLFYTRDYEIDTLLELGTSEPFNVAANDAAVMLRNIDNNLQIAMERGMSAPTAQVQKKARQAIAALRKLRLLYESPIEEEVDVEVVEEVTKQIDEEELDDYETEITSLAVSAREGRNQERFAQRLIEISVAAAVGAYLASLGQESTVTLTDQQLAALEARLKIIRSSAAKFQASLDAGEFEGEAGLKRMLNRLNLWTNNLAGIYEMGKIFEAPGKRFQWRLGRTVEHCKDCLNLNGKVYTSEKWQELGIYPRSHDLECGGWRCDCSFYEVEGSETPGPMPTLQGRKTKEH